MTYIIENACLVQGNVAKNLTMLIKNKKIDLIGTSFKRYHYMKMDLSSFVMAPSFFRYDHSLPFGKSPNVFKEYMISQYLLKGCTGMFTHVELEFENELTVKLKKMLIQLLNSPVDFIVGVKIPIRLLTPQFIRQCKKEKISAIFVTLNEGQSLDGIPWGWLRDAMFPYNPVLIPIVKTKDNKVRKRLLSDWKQTMQTEKIPSLPEEMNENSILPQCMIHRLGISPVKGTLMQGSEISYNLYLRNFAINNVDSQALFLYHGNSLKITVHKGKVIRFGENILYQPGFGEHVRVRIPAFFNSN